MPFPGVPPNLQDLDARTGGRLNRAEQAREQEALLDRNDEGISQASRPPGIGDRLRSLFQRRSQAGSAEPADSDSNPCAQERQHRRETETDRLGGGTLP